MLMIVYSRAENGSVRSYLGTNLSEPKKIGSGAWVNRNRVCKPRFGSILVRSVPVQFGRFSRFRPTGFIWAKPNKS